MQPAAITSDTSPISRPAARLSIAATAAVILLLSSLHVLSPEFDPSWRVVSEYALGQYGWVLSLMFLCWAVSSWALADAIRSQLRTRGGKIGLGFLIAAGIGEAMASVFDVPHPLHNLAGVVGVLGLPVAAMLISTSLTRAQPWSSTRKLLLLTANLTWFSAGLMFAALIIMILGYIEAVGFSTTAEVKVLPPGVIALVGYANRLLVVVYCVWVTTVAWQAIKLRRGAVALRQSYA
ncbi:MAG: DUF998 domain-containing protein [Gemmatimonadaceae bacterium]